jgi:hypothetical protein
VGGGGVARIFQNLCFSGQQTENKTKLLFTTGPGTHPVFFYTLGAMFLSRR